jgi:eukaryotic-like serine/threonine-protein kinase
MTAISTCKECGTAIPADSAGGWCPQCLLGLGLDTARPAEEITDSPESELPGDHQANQARASEWEPGKSSAEPEARVGRYRLLKELGHGGCGIVYQAGQKEPVRRKVALKVIKLGMDTRQVVARFEAERQALALMDHPSIAKVFDGGTIGDPDSQLCSPTPQLFLGRPYFVMELVDGIPITDYCDQNRLTTRQRMDLFIQVCRAIQHAHQKGIIHRDIKPSNVLVATQDGIPVPKVIDFGIAKAVQGRLTDQTVFTSFEQFVGTPAYMSPEQSQFGGLDVDTRTDIYSLGVLLYELLTGRTPFDSKELLVAGVETMRRTIQEKAPPIPSSRIKQEWRTNRSDTPAKSKIQNPKCAIEQDLDWIVMKCLEKDRARRYETANGLARDIERYLKHEPVIACPPSRLYTFRKAVERNKAAFSSAAIVALVLVLGICGSTWQAVRATHAERRENLSLEQSKIAQANEARERKKAQTALAQMQSIEIRRAEEYYEAGDRRHMLPYLALVLRQNPENRLAAERLMSTLSHRFRAHLGCSPLIQSNRLTWAMFDKQGTRVVTSSADGTAWVWDAATGRPLAGPFVHAAEINNADFSPDARFVVTASEDKTARVWDSSTGNPVTPPLEHSNSVSLAKFSPKGDLVLTVSQNQTFLWNAQSGQLQHPLDCGNVISDACFSPDGSTVAVACFGGQAQIWDVVSGLCLQRFTHSNHVKSVAFSPDGKWLVSGSHDNSARVWDAQTGRQHGEALLHDGILLSAEFAPDGQRVITASADHTAQIWEIGTGKKIGPPLTHSLEARSALFSAEGTRVVTASDQTVQLWDAFSGAALTEPLVHESSAFYAQFHPDGERVLTVSNGKAALIWEITGVPALTLFFSNVVESFDFSPDGRALITASDGAHTRLWDPWTGKPLTPPLAERDSQRIARVVFSFDGKRVATAAPDDGVARIWNSADGKPITTNLLHGIGVSHICFSPDGQRLLTASTHRTCLWETGTGKLLLSADMAALPDSRSFSADGEMFLGLPEPRTARIFSTKTGEPLSPPLAHMGDLTYAMFSPDGQSLLTTAGETSFIIWDIKSGRRLGTNFQHREPLLQATYSLDGKHVLAVTEKYRAQVWNLEEGLSLTGEFGGRFYIRNAAFCGDGSRVALTLINGSAQLWDSTSGSRLSEALPNGKNPIWTRTSVDGRLLAVSSKDEKKVTIWEIPSADLPVPTWLPELAEALAGQRFNSEGVLELVPPAALWSVQQDMAAFARGEAATTAYGRWAKWFVADASNRTVLPSSPVTLREYVRSLLEQGTPQSWRQALLLEPGNAVALARVGGSITNGSLADWMTQRAVELAPGNETWTERARVLSRAGRTDESTKAMARATALEPKRN